MGAIIRQVAVPVPEKRCPILFRKKIVPQKSKQQLFIRDQYCNLAVVATHCYKLGCGEGAMARIHLVCMIVSL